MEPLPQGSRPGGWRAWTATSATSLWIDRGLAVVDGIAMLLAGSISLGTLVAGRALPVPGVLVVLIAAGPVLVAGQLWAIAILQPRPRPRGRSFTKSRIYFFPDLPKRTGNALVYLFLLGAAGAMSAFPFLLRGNPVHPTVGCAWPLENHGAITCVSHSTYVAAGAAAQRLASSILFSFFTAHFGVAASELCRRRAQTHKADPGL